MGYGVREASGDGLGPGVDCVRGPELAGRPGAPSRCPRVGRPGLQPAPRGLGPAGIPALRPSRGSFPASSLSVPSGEPSQGSATFAPRFKSRGAAQGEAKRREVGGLSWGCSGARRPALGSRDPTVARVGVLDAWHPVCRARPGVVGEGGFAYIRFCRKGTNVLGAFV